MTRIGLNTCTLFYLATLRDMCYFLHLKYEETEFLKGQITHLMSFS